MAQSNPAIPAKALIGMVHVGALPGSPRSTQGVDALATQAAAEARILADAGFDALLVENMHDVPYVPGPHPPETIAAMTRVVQQVREAAPSLALGVQVLAFGHIEAMAIAHTCGASFIRVENFTFAHVADEGLMPSAAAGELLRYRARLGAHGVRVICDIKKKHAAHAITQDLSLEESAHAAEFFGADGLIVTGEATGRPASHADVEVVRAATRLPLWVGSGVTPDQVPALLAHADALVVGSWIKKDGNWRNPVDPDRCRQLVKARR
ncbi:MAG: BtpA/SgcQ family protein [Phycisphaerales bacterium]|nr:BtpA/SgcQ family protein [Phycisphaerales bacterium]